MSTRRVHFAGKKMNKPAKSKIKKKLQINQVCHSRLQQDDISLNMFTRQQTEVCTVYTGAGSGASCQPPWTSSPGGRGAHPWACILLCQELVGYVSCSVEARICLLTNHLLIPSPPLTLSSSSSSIYLSLAGSNSHTHNLQPRKRAHKHRHSHTHTYLHKHKHEKDTFSLSHKERDAREVQVSRQMSRSDSKCISHPHSDSHKTKIDAGPGEDRYCYTAKVRDSVIKHKSTSSVYHFSC